MTRLRVHRSPVRQFLMGVAGLFLLVVAIEIVWAHQLTLDPETDDNGALTPRGESRRRQDVVVGTAFLLTGGGLVVIAIAGLVSSRPVVEVDDRHIRLRIAGPQRMLTLRWEEVVEVRSAREPGEGRGVRPLLLLLLRHPDDWPAEYWGARREGQWLIVDADSWAKPPEEVVVHARLALGAWQRASMALPDEEA